MLNVGSVGVSNLFLTQDYPYYDVLVIDDCSTDLTWDYIKYYKVCATRNKVRQGALANIVKGIDLIGREYYCYG